MSRGIYNIIYFMNLFYFIKDIQDFYFILFKMFIYNENEL